MRIRHAIIMAAGRGQRMMPLTTALPKPMLPYNGSTLVANGIQAIRRHVDHLHVTVGYKGPMLAQHLIEQGVSTVLNTSGMGNSWWIYNTVMANIDEPVFVLTCDNIMEVDFELLAESYDQSGRPACMVVPVRPVPGLDGDFVFHEKGVVTRLSRSDRTDIYCSGLQILNPAHINRLTKRVDDFGAVWNQLIQIQQLQCSAIYPKQWISIDTVAQWLTIA